MYVSRCTKTSIAYLYQSLAPWRLKRKGWGWGLFISFFPVGSIYFRADSKFCKTKYICGRYIEGQWVFGGICRGTKAPFLVPVRQKPDKDTVLPIMLANILAGIQAC